MPAAPPNSRRGLRILFAEDSREFAQVLVHILQAAGYTVRHAPDGLEAWEQLFPAVDSYDLLITDNRMPGLGGIELVERARHAGFAGRIIVYTSGLSAVEHQRYSAERVDAIVSKAGDPFALPTIVDAFFPE